jgi:predicted nucleic acid-binding protein
MITAVLDTNIFLQHLISSPRSASVRTFDGHFRIAYSPAMVDELLDVLMLPRIHDRHGLTDAEVLEYLAALFVSGGHARLTAHHP